MQMQMQMYSRRSAFRSPPWRNPCCSRQDAGRALVLRSVVGCSCTGSILCNCFSPGRSVLELEGTDSVRSDCI
jgi:hypothetical protein